MEVFKDALSEHTLDIFREHHELFKDKETHNDINNFGIDIRTLMHPGTKAFDEVKKICQKHFPNVQDNEIYANYQRQSKPTFLHVDEYGTNRKTKTWTIIIPMHTDDRIGVLLFKDFFNTNDEIQKTIMNFDYDKSTKKSNVSQDYPISHLPYNYKDVDDKFIDYLDLAGVFAYQLGNYVLFDTNQIHASTDFTVYPEYQHKDLVQIHIGPSADEGYNPYHKEKIKI